jgi:hypothetical protein
VVAVLGAHEARAPGDGARQLAGDLDGLGARGGEERVLQPAREQPRQRLGSLRPAGRRQQPVTHVVLAQRRAQRLDRELRVVAEVEHAARAAAVDVVAALQVPHTHALAPALHEIDPQIAKRLGLVGGDEPLDQRKRVVVGSG